MSKANRSRCGKSVGERSVGQQGGFTIIELMIVLVILAILVAIIVPNLMAARLSANETSAVARLRTVTTAQAQFRSSAKADEDLDAQGEYGYFAELGGSVGVRGGAQMVPTDLPASMGFVTSTGEVPRAGYVFRLYLPATGGVGTREQGSGGISAGTLDPDLAEVAWGCYAWPLNSGVTGSRTFFVSASGELTQTVNLLHSGPDAAAITAGAALVTTDVTLMTADLAVGTVGGDGSVWRAMQQ